MVIKEKFFEKYLVRGISSRYPVTGDTANVNCWPLSEMVSYRCYRYTPSSSSLWYELLWFNNVLLDKHQLIADRSCSLQACRLSTKPQLDIEGKVFQMFDFKLGIKSVKGFIKCSEFMMFSSIRNIRKWCILKTSKVYRVRVYAFRMYGIGKLGSGKI